METLRNTVETRAAGYAGRLLEALAAAGIADWADIDSIDKICTVRDFIDETTNSGSTYAAKLAAIIGRYEDQLQALPRDWRENLSIKRKKSQQTFLSLDDIRKLIDYVPKKNEELFIQLSAIIELRTGTRISDAKELDERNIVEGTINYVSKKTGVEAFIPYSPALMHILRLRDSLGIAEYSDQGFNKALKRLAGDAGITDEVKLYRRGEYREEEKSLAIASHTLRRTFCTQLHLAGEDIYSIMRWAGHKSVNNTAGYIRAQRRPNAPRYSFFDLVDKMIEQRFPLSSMEQNSNPLSKLAAV